MTEGINPPTDLGPRMVCPRITEPLWTAEETARKRALLETGHPLTQHEQRIYRAAECILAWETYDEPTYLTVPAIKRCTGIAQSKIQESIANLVGRELLVAQDQLQTPSIDSYPPIFYFPVVQGDGSSFFAPRPRPGCRNTLVEYTLDRLKHIPLAVVEYLAYRLADEGKNYVVTQKDVLKFLPEWSTRPSEAKKIASVLRTLSSGDILRAVSPGRRAASYTLTDRGIWFLKKVPLEAETRQDAPQKDSFTQESLDSELVGQVRKQYPEELHDNVLATIVDHLNLGILEGGVSYDREGRQLTETKSLNFHPDVAVSLDRKKRALIAHYLRLDLLLYGYALSGDKVRQMLGISGSVSPARFIKNHYYTPLLLQILQQRESLPED